MTHEEKVLTGNRRKKYESGGGHAEPLPSLAPPSERRLCNLSTEKLLFAPVLWWHGPTPNTEFGTRWDWWSHLIRDLAALQGSKSHLRHFVVYFLLLTLKPGGFVSKQSGQRVLPFAMKAYLERGSLAQHPPMGYEGQVHLKVPYSKEYRVWPVSALGDGTGAPSPLWLAGPSAPSRKGLGTQHRHRSHTSVLSRYHRAPEWQCLAKNTSDQPTNVARLHWFVPVPLPVNHFWPKAPAAPLGRRMTPRFLFLLNPSDIQPEYGWEEYGWEGQRTVYATGKSLCESASCIHMKNLPLLSRFEAQNKPTKIYNLLFAVSQHKICPLLPAKRYRDIHTPPSTPFWSEIFLNCCRC